MAARQPGKQAAPCGLSLAHTAPCAPMLHNLQQCKCAVRRENPSPAAPGTHS